MLAAVKKIGFVYLVFGLGFCAGVAFMGLVFGLAGYQLDPNQMPAAELSAKLT